LRENKNKKKITSKRVGVRESGVRANKLSGKKINFSNERSGEIKMTFTQKVKNTLKRRLMKKLKELENNNDGSGKK